jgi:serine/threonine-protein kinase
MDTELEARALALLDDALEQSEAEREAWLARACGRDDQLHGRMKRLLRLRGSGSIRTGAAPLLAQDQELPNRIGAYRIIGMIGQGGMGSVYRGDRAVGDFEHVAAIKLIRPGALSDELVERFRRERQTLAKLSHPHIARLFDGGETPAGQPYLVMEYVEGQPLGSWLSSAAPTRIVRLALFRKICMAVAYAHRNLIIHRDLTPANILVDRAGEPKLIDFGIARLADEEGGDVPAQTATPGYAPPERLAGAPATTLTDIFALGRLLDLLAEGGADTDLLAIIAKAAAEDPSRRYATVDALIDDLDRHADGRPVNACGGGAAYRTRRFVGRHRVPVAAAAAALLLLIGALVVTTIANRRAEVARADAEQRFEQTRAIAKTLLFETFDEVGKVPGGTGAQVLLARTALTYLDALAPDRTAPDDVRAEVGRGYTRLSRAVGGGGGGQLGKLADADQLLRKASAIVEPLYARRPGDPGVAQAYAEMLIESAAQNLYNHTRPDLARVQARRARAALEPFKERTPEVAALYATSWQGEGDSYGWDENWSPALRGHLEAERFIAALPPTLRGATPVLKTRSANLRLLGEAHHKLKQEGAARTALASAVAVNEELVRRAPVDPDPQRKLALSLWFSAVVHRTNGRAGEAEQAIGRAVFLARALKQRDPSGASALQLLAATTEVQAQVLADARRFRDSFAAADAAVATQRQLVALAGAPPGARRSLATLLKSSGANRYAGGDYARACRDWSEALAIHRGFQQQGTLTETDRQNGLVSLSGLIAGGCNPPRGGMVVPD